MKTSILTHQLCTLGLWLYASGVFANAVDHSKDITLRPSLNTSSTAIETFSGSGDSVTFDPETPVRAGLGFSWRSIGLALGRRVGQSKTATSSHHDTLSFTFTTDILHLEVDGERISGFDKKSAEGDQQRVPLELNSAQARIQLFVRPGNFSIRSATNQTARQKKSGGSPLIWVGGGTVRLEQFSLDLSNTDSPISQVSQSGAGLGLGYAHNFVSGPSFLTLIGDWGRLKQSTELRSDTEQKTFESLATQWSLKGILGFHFRHFFGGTSAQVESTDTKFSQQTLRIQRVKTSLFLGIHF